MRITLTIEGTKKTVSLMAESETEKQMLKIYFEESDNIQIQKKKDSQSNWQSDKIGSIDIVLTKNTCKTND